MQHEQPRPAAPSDGETAGSYRSPRGPANALRWLFSALIALSALGIAASVVEHRFYGGYEEGETVDEDAELPVVFQCCGGRPSS